MPSARPQKSKAKPPARKAVRARPAVPSKARRPTPPKAGSARPSTARPSSKPAAKSAPPASGTSAPVRRADGRVHVLSLSFVRDGDEFLARMETDAGQITELKNRSLDQLLTLVASELEDLLE